MSAVSRDQLFDLVWKMPVQQIARAAGISEVALAKKCRNANIPLPGRGHWRKLKTHKPLKRAVLPPRDFAAPAEIKLSLPPELLARLKAPNMPETMEVLTERFRKRLGRVAKVRSVSRLHPAIAVLQTQPAYCPDLRWWWEGWFKSFDRRRLRLLNAILLGLDKGGCRATVCDIPARLILVSIGGARLFIVLERSNPGPVTHPNDLDAEYRMALRIYSDRQRESLRHEIREDAGFRLAENLKDVVVAVAVAAQNCRCD